MLAFDAPSREVCTVSRGRTNTPLQALVLLNDVQFVEAARGLAAAVAAGSTGIEEPIDQAFVRLTGRHADATELAVLKDIYDEQSAAFKEKASQDAAPFLALGEARSAAKEPAHLAALTVVCQAILNLDATITER